MASFFQSSASMRRWLAWGFAVVQLCWLAGFAKLGLVLPSDNRIDTFAVRADQTASEFEVFRQVFGDSEHFLLCLQLEHFPSEQQIEAINDFYALLDDLHHLRLLSEGLSWSDGQEPDGDLLPFPFWDAQSGVLTAIFDLETQQQREDTLIQVQQQVRDFANQDWIQQAVVAGEPLVNLGLNQSSEEVRDQIFPILIVISMLFLGFLFRAWRATFVAMIAVLLSLFTVMGSMSLFGLRLNLVTTLIPALVFVLALAMQIHVLIGIAQKGDVLQGVRAKLKPNFLVALTTSLGFGSLVTSQVRPIAEMGMIMACAIWIIFCWTHLVHLGWSLALGLRVQDRLRQSLSYLGDRPAYQKLIEQPALVWFGALIIGLGGYALYVNPMESNGLNYFPDHHPVAQQARFLEEKVTGSSDLELLFPLDADIAPQKLVALGERLGELDQVRHVLSLPRLGQYLVDLSAQADEDLPLDEALELLREEMPDFTAHFEQGSWVRVQLLVNAMNRDTFTSLRQQVFAEVEVRGLPTPVLTGSLARVVNIQSYLLSSLFKGLSITIVLVFFLMTVIFRNFKQPQLILLPNLFPLACMALMMWLLAIPTTISTVMVFSIAFGIAVDDTIHLMFAYRFRHQGPHLRRWRLVLISDGRAVMLTTAILTVGFSVLLVSDFLPTRHFGILLATGMLAALLGDISLLPRMLRSFAGDQEEETLAQESKLEK